MVSICFSERFIVPSAIVAEKLIADGTIGSVIQTVGLGPHRLNRAIRPAWFFDARSYGGILVDIASHQIDQYLHFTGSVEADIVADGHDVVRAVVLDRAPGAAVWRETELELGANDTWRAQNCP